MQANNSTIHEAASKSRPILERSTLGEKRVDGNHHQQEGSKEVPKLAALHDSSDMIEHVRNRKGYNSTVMLHIKANCLQQA